MYAILMVTKLGYIDGKWQTIYSIHTDPMGYDHSYDTQMIHVWDIYLHLP